MRNIIISLIILFPLLLHSQANNSGTFKVRKPNVTQEQNIIQESAIVDIVEPMPQFPGGDSALF